MEIPSNTDQKNNKKDLIQSSESWEKIPTVTPDKLSNQELFHKYKDGEHGIHFNHHIYIIASGGMYVGGALLIILGIVWCAHLVLPEHLRWLSELEVHGIERLLFSSVIISIAGRYFRKFRIIENKENNKE